MFKRKYNRVTGIFIGLILSTLCLADKLYIFYPTPIRPKVLQQTMGDAFPRMEITVFGRYADFMEAVHRVPPDAILTKSPLITQLDEFQVKLTGVRNGYTEESYVLLSVDKEPDLMNPAAMTVGIVDFLGRKEMQRFVNIFFDKSPNIKRVTKLEDLLPLLTFNMVDSIMVTEPEVAYFKRISHLNFKVTGLNTARVGIITLAVKKIQEATTIPQVIKVLPEKINSLFGIEQWR